MTRTRQIRWWTLGHYPLEPPPLHLLVRIGISLAVIGFVAAGASWIFQGQISTWPNGSRCSCQLQRRDQKRREIGQQLKISSLRTNAFQKALQDQTNPSFTIAREQIQKEQEIYRKLTEAASSLEIESFRDFSVGLLTLLVPAIVLSMVAGRLIVAQAHSAGVLRPEEVSLTDWRLPYYCFVGLPFAVDELQEIKTSVWDLDKTWFGWSSFCVCPSAWFLFSIMVLGVLMVIAYPASLMWSLTKPSRRPTALHVDANDGAWGVGSYVLFLQTWSIVLLVFLLLPALGWLKIVGASSRMSIDYVATGTCLLLLVLVLEARIMWNAVQIRLSYQGALKQLGGTWSSIRAQDPPGDPTRAFLGEQWWSLPAVVFATVAALWALVQWSGVGTLLEQLLIKGSR